jgi:phosphohistidine phosphatase
LKTLVLMRHAKSSHDQPLFDDHDRPLAPRGIAAAPLIGRWLAARIAPNLVLVSSAVRTRQTWALVAPAMTRGTTVSTCPELYLAEPHDILSTIRTVPDATSTLLLVGHNPGFHTLTLQLAGDGKRSLREAVTEKFPSAGVAILTFDAAHWSDLATARGRLTDFMTPKRLASEKVDA